MHEEKDRLLESHLELETELLSEGEALEDRLAEARFYPFLQKAFEITEPGVEFATGEHIELLCDHLELLFAGKILNLVVNIPPGHMKSLSCSVAFPCWVWIHWPESRWIFSSYSSGLSNNLAQKRQDIIRSPWYRRRWGKTVEINRRMDSLSQTGNTARGMFISTSTGGTTGGKHSDITVADDPQNPEDDASEAARRAANAHIRYLHTRKRSQKKSRFLLIMQRLHHDDACAQFDDIQKNLAQSGHDVEKYKLLSLPSKAKSPTRIVFPRSVAIGEDKKPAARVWERKTGEPLWPQQVGLKELQALAIDLGPLRYAAQYDQDPTPEEGNLFKREYLRTWSDLPRPTYSFWSLDTAIEENEENDFTAAVRFEIFMGRDGYPHFYLEDFRNEHIEAADLEDWIMTVQAAKKADFWLIEKKGSGNRVVQYFRRRKGLPVIEFNPKPYGDKYARLYRCVSDAAAGRIYLPEPMDHPREKQEEFISQLLRFPRAKNDDLADAFSQGIIYIKFERTAGRVGRGRDEKKSSKRRRPVMPGRKNERKW